MLILLYILLAIIFLMFVISILKLSIFIDFQHLDDDDHLKIRLKTLFGLLRYTINVPLIKMDKQSSEVIVSQQEGLGDMENELGKKQMKRYTPEETIFSLKLIKQIATHVIDLHVIVKKFLSHISITKFEWHTKLGTGDAANTGLAVGIGWSVKYGVVAVLSKYMKLKSAPLLSINPDFLQPVSETKFVCMIQFRIGHAMLAGLRIVKYWRGSGLSKIKSLVADNAN